MKNNNQRRLVEYTIDDRIEYYTKVASFLDRILTDSNCKTYTEHVKDVESFLRGQRARIEKRLEYLYNQPEETKQDWRSDLQKELDAKRK